MPSRIDDFDYNTLGQMVTPNGQDGLKLKQPIKDMSTRMLIPKPLVDYLRKRLLEDYHVSPTVMKHFPDVKLVRFWLLQGVPNLAQRHDLITLLDNDYRVMSKVQRVLDANGAAQAVGNGGGFDSVAQGQLDDVAEDTTQIKKAMNKLYQSMNHKMDTIQPTVQAAYMAGVLAAYTGMGWNDTVAAPGDKDALAHVTSEDNFIRMARLIRQKTAPEEQHRVDHDKQTERESEK